MMMDIEFDLGPRTFTWMFDRNLRGRICLLVIWYRETQFPNIRYMHFVTFHWLSPWFRSIKGMVTD